LAVLDAVRDHAVADRGKRGREDRDDAGQDQEHHKIDIGREEVHGSHRNKQHRADQNHRFALAADLLAEPRSEEGAYHRSGQRDEHIRNHQTCVTGDIVEIIQQHCVPSVCQEAADEHAD